MATDPRIGEKLREARRQRDLTIDQLARRTGLTKGFLSQVERDLATTSVASLLRICDALGLRVGELFDTDEPGLVRVADRPELHFGGVGVHDRLLTPRTTRKIQVIHSIVEPGGHSDPPAYVTPSEAQFVHVTKGTFEITLAGTAYTLDAGDSLTFGGREARSWRNPGSGPVELLWVITPSLF
jgi:transcriptional regulator with XRE-family HTH domain